ncbi:hypothetical protein PVAP13_2KG137301 [Panicum virgatum]|uniref:Uncharacterized protein n=1 Tax=Panicum virgatum TaxID=38727 RepID=A0A8T0WCX0_PANVG|nr:hypothetical protein PVAP13_2KG137301 [Panicum virgatum]
MDPQEDDLPFSIDLVSFIGVRAPFLLPAPADPRAVEGTQVAGRSRGHQVGRSSGPSAGRGRGAPLPPGTGRWVPGMAGHGLGPGGHRNCPKHPGCTRRWPWSGLYR